MEDSFVTISQCDSKHKNTRNMLGVIVIFLSLVMTGVGWSVAAAYSATTNANEQREQLNIHKAVENTMDQYTKEKLDKIEVIVTDLQRKINTLEKANK